MSKLFSVVCALVLMVALQTRARAQSDNVITTEDPAAFARELADRVSAEGVDALRPILTEIYAIQMRTAGAQLPAQQAAIFDAAQAMIAGREASIISELDDIVLGGAFRTIFYYHYFGDNVWIFSRFDFVRMDDRRWALSLLLWGGDASLVGLSPAPTFRSEAAERN